MYAREDKMRETYQDGENPMDISAMFADDEIAAKEYDDFIHEFFEHPPQEDREFDHDPSQDDEY